jgi:hypothetical protein
MPDFEDLSVEEPVDQAVGAKQKEISAVRFALVAP